MNTELLDMVWKSELGRHHKQVLAAMACVADATGLVTEYETQIAKMTSMAESQTHRLIVELIRRGFLEHVSAPAGQSARAHHRFDIDRLHRSYREQPAETLHPIIESPTYRDLPPIAQRRPIRVRVGLSAEDIGTFSGVDKSMIYRYEKDLHTPGRDRNLYAEVLHLCTEIPEVITWVPQEPVSAENPVADLVNSRRLPDPTDRTSIRRAADVSVIDMALLCEVQPQEVRRWEEGNPIRRPTRRVRYSTVLRDLHCADVGPISAYITISPYLNQSSHRNPQGYEAKERTPCGNSPTRT